MFDKRFFTMVVLRGVGVGFIGLMLLSFVARLLWPSLTDQELGEQKVNNWPLPVGLYAFAIGIGIMECFWCWKKYIRNSNKKENFVMPLSISVIGFLLLVWGVYLTKMNANIHNIVETRSMMELLAGHIQYRVSDREGAPPTNIEMLWKWLDFNDLLKTEFDHDSYIVWDYEAGILRDRWGSPVSLVAKSSNEYTFISFGPNRKDNKGGGDDITYTFDPFALNKPHDANIIKS